MKTQSLPLLLSLVLIGAAFPAGSADDPVEPIEIQLTIEIDDPASERVHLHAVLSGLEGAVTLSLPEGYSYSRLAEPRLDGEVELVDASAQSSLERRGPFQWYLDPGSQSAAHLSWSVVLDHRRLPEAEGDAYGHPYLAEDHGLLIMAAMAIAPEVPYEGEVRFVLPSGWPLEAPWVANEEGSYPVSSGSLHTDLVAIGHWDTHRVEVAGMDMTLAFAPGQDELFASVREDLPPIVEMELELFGGAVQPRYLFLFGRPDQISSYGGSPHDASMTLFASSDLPPDFAAEGVRHLIAHEFHHTWMKARCQPEGQLRFVMEGFTDYYARLVPWRLLLCDDAALAASWNEALERGTSALEQWPEDLLAAGGPAFFQGGPPYDACYAAGLIQALWMDLALRRKGANLDDFLRSFYNDPRWEDGTRPTLADWLALVEAELGSALTALHESSLRHVGRPDWEALFAAVEVELGPAGKGFTPDLVRRLE